MRLLPSDLLAFTLILPLFPALISHYRSHDSSGLFAWLESRVDWFRLVVGAPAQASHSISLTGSANHRYRPVWSSGLNRQY